MINEMELPEKKSALEELKENIKGAKEGIEREFSKGFNSWPACFGSRVFQAETYLSIKPVREELGQDKYKEARGKLEDLKTQLQKLKEEYPEANTIPPEETREEFIKKLKEIL